MALVSFVERKNPPIFTKKPSEELEDIEGRLVKMEARVSGSQPMSILWLKNGADISGSDDYDFSFKSNVAVLCIKNSLRDHSGRYSCQATNDAGQAECDVTLKISGQFALTNEMEDV